jgi:alkane 1-monooxygenase
MSPLGFAFAYLVPLSAAAGLSLGGPWLLTTPLFVFAITPVLDSLVGRSERNPNGDEDGQRLRHDVWLWLWLPVQFGILAWGLAAFVGEGVGIWERVAIAITVGIVTGGGGITISHELMHRSDRLSRALAEILMSTVGYTHFCIEHVLGHHKNVATPRDPATSRRGETVWAFLPRTISGGLRSAWNLEGKRIQRAGINTWSLKNRRLRYAMDLVLVAIFFWALAGPLGLAFFLGQSAMAVFLLEIINYVEHYGLTRNRDAQGRYERVTPNHSWNSAHRLTGWYLFNLPRHADHHAWAARPYWMLRHFDGAPQLPAGYATMILVALCPPLWFSLMDKRVDRLKNAAHEKSKHPHRPDVLDLHGGLRQQPEQAH